MRSSRVCGSAMCGMMSMLCIASHLLPSGQSGLACDEPATFVRTQDAVDMPLGRGEPQPAAIQSAGRLREPNNGDLTVSLSSVLTYGPTYTQRTPRMRFGVAPGARLVRCFLRKRIAGKPLARVHQSGRCCELQKRMSWVEQHGCAARYASVLGADEWRNATLDRPQICDGPFLQTPRSCGMTHDAMHTGYWTSRTDSTDRTDRTDRSSVCTANTPLLSMTLHVLSGLMQR